MFTRSKVKNIMTFFENMQQNGSSMIHIFHFYRNGFFSFDFIILLIFLLYPNFFLPFLKTCLNVTNPDAILATEIYQIFGAAMSKLNLFELWYICFIIKQLKFEEIENSNENDDASTCTICLQNLKMLYVILPCGHSSCLNCCVEWMMHAAIRSLHISPDMFEEKKICFDVIKASKIYINTYIHICSLRCKQDVYTSDQENFFFKQFDEFVSKKKKCNQKQ